MNEAGKAPWLPRFLAPGHASCEYANTRWQAQGEADTPSADAHCSIRVAFDTDAASGRIEHAAFSIFGPPVAVACADWACEWLAGRTIDAARGLTVEDFEQALKLAPGERYAALLAIDALASALANRRCSPS